MGNWGEITPTSRGAIFTQVMTGTPPPDEPLKKNGRILSNIHGCLIKGINLSTQ